MAAKPVFADRARLDGWMARLRAAVAAGDRAAAEAVFEAAMPHFRERHAQRAGRAPAIGTVTADAPLAGAASAAIG